MKEPFRLSQKNDWKSCSGFVRKVMSQMSIKGQSGALTYDRITTAEAAAILNVSPQFVRIGLQQEKLPIGTAVKMSGRWTYHISAKLLADYSGKDVLSELKAIRGQSGIKQKAT